MKQTQLVIEVILNDDNKPTILVRDPRGNVVKITSDPAEVSTFLCEVVEKMSNPSLSNSK